MCYSWLLFFRRSAQVWCKVTAATWARGILFLIRPLLVPMTQAPLWHGRPQDPRRQSLQNAPKPPTPTCPVPAIVSLPKKMPLAKLTAVRLFDQRFRGTSYFGHWSIYIFEEAQLSTLSIISAIYSLSSNYPLSLFPNHPFLGFSIMSARPQLFTRGLSGLGQSAETNSPAEQRDDAKRNFLKTMRPLPTQHYWNVYFDR